MNWRRFDTLGLRLFVLMWVVLVLSHLVAYGLAMPLLSDGGPGIAERLKPQNLPTLTSLPPGAPFDRGPPPGGPPPDGARMAPSNGPGPGGPPGPNRFGLSGVVLWADYGLRLLITALGAALAARWLASPMRRLARASRDLSEGLARGKAPPVLDTRRGSAEVRETARVFNDMATRLQEQFDARGMHLASVSHDLRTPLTRLRMRLEDAPPALAHGTQADIHEMSEMIDSTLEVLHEQREGSAARIVDMRALLEAMVDDWVEAGHDVTLAEPVGGADPHALARPAALKRIVGNLVGNALRYGGSAHLALHDSAGSVQVTVDDTGPGIPAEQLELAFRPWVRLTSAHARSGHGLGLAIARDLAERDGGRLTLANRAEGGLRALLQLPAATTVSAPTNNV